MSYNQMSNISTHYKKQKELESGFQKIIESDVLWGRLLGKITESSVMTPSKKVQFQKILENERKYILTEQSDNSSLDVAKVQKIVLPLVRRFWPKLIANEIVSTQPLTAPTGFIRRLVVNYQNTELPGVVPASDQQIPQSVETLATADGVTGFDQTYFLNSGTLSTNLQLGSIEVKVLVEATGTEGANNVKTPVQTVARDDGHGKLNGEFIVYRQLSGGTTWTEHKCNTYGTIDYKTGVMVLYISNATVASYGRGILSVASSKDWQMAESSDFTNREVTFEIRQETIIQTERKLRTSWKPEFVEDLSAIDGIDAQSELYENVQNILAQEINSQILSELYAGHQAANETTWSSTQPANLSGAGFYGTRKEWYETLMIKINELAATMQSRTNIAQPNILVMHPTALQYLRNALASYSAGGMKPLDDESVSVGYNKFDINAGQYTVYSTNLVDTSKILFIYKGSKIEESGYVYSPYVPLTAIPWTESTGQMGIVFHTRYGTKLFRPDWFGQLEITQ